jgi:hypothetical protein
MAMVPPDAMPYGVGSVVPAGWARSSMAATMVLMETGL